VRSGGAGWSSASLRAAERGGWDTVKTMNADDASSARQQRRIVALRAWSSARLDSRGDANLASLLEAALGGAAAAKLDRLHRVPRR
jgi:hypothetical protein